MRQNAEPADQREQQKADRNEMPGELRCLVHVRLFSLNVRGER